MTYIYDIENIIKYIYVHILNYFFFSKFEYCNNVADTAH